MEERLTQLLERMDGRADEWHRESMGLLERMDQRADERHREVFEAIRALKVA
jgi:hypothetical protein